MKTTGERLAQRQLVMESRAGVPHYKPGQLGAVVSHVRDDEEGIDAYGGTVSFVNEMGHVVVICAIYDDGRWTPMVRTTSGPRLSRNWEVAPDDALTGEMLAALKKAHDQAKNEETD